jgi:hypothetical protein
MRRSKRAGFTVVDAVIATAIVVGATWFLYEDIRGSKELASAAPAGRVDVAGRRAAMAMVSEVRWADPDLLLITTESGASRVDFRVAEDRVDGEIEWSPVITFRYEPSPIDWNENGVLDEGTVTRTQAGSTRELCRLVEEGGLVIEKLEDTISIKLNLTAINDDGLLRHETVDTSATLLNGQGT